MRFAPRWHLWVRQENLRMSTSSSLLSPGDRQAMAGFYSVYMENRTHFQIGDNTNLFDWTYVGNVAKAHLLAADKLDTPPPAPPIATLEKRPTTIEELPPLNDAELEILSRPLGPISATLKGQRVPTSEARPLGPYLEKPQDGDKIEANFNNPDFEPSAPRPVIKNRFDQFSATAIQQAKLTNPDIHPLQVAGQIFHITNGEPIFFWDLLRFVWNEFDKHHPGHRQPRKPFVMPQWLGMAAAFGSEVVGAILKKEMTFTRFKVTFSCASRWYNIEKARRILGYEPDVGIYEGAQKSVEVSFYFIFHLEAG